MSDRISEVAKLLPLVPISVSRAEAASGTAVSKVLAMLEESANHHIAQKSSLSSRYKRLYNNARSTRDAIASGDMAVSDLKEWLKDTKAEIAELSAAKVEVPAAMKRSKVVSELTAYDLSVIDGDQLALDNATGRIVRDREEATSLAKKFTEFNRFAAVMPTKDVAKTKKFVVLRLPVTPITEGMTNIAKLVKTMGAVDLDGRYCAIPNQLVVAISQDFRESVAENTAVEKSMLESLQKDFDDAVKKLNKKLPAKVVEKGEEKAQAWHAKKLTELKSAFNEDKTKLTRSLRREANKVGNSNSQTNEARLQRVVNSIEDRLGHEVKVMDGVAKFRSSGFLYYWLVTEGELKHIREAFGSRDGFELEWGFPFN